MAMMWKSFPKAFTLTDTLFTLASLLLLLNLTIPFTRRHFFPLTTLQSYIIKAQSLAIHHRQRVDVIIDHRTITIDTQSFSLPFTCQPVSFYFNHLGNVSQAHTIHCHSHHRQYRLAVELGGGVLEIK